MRGISENQKIMLDLIQRSPDIGDGWRQVSDGLWGHVVEQAHPDLTELDTTTKRVRFTDEGITVMRYL